MLTAQRQTTAQCPSADLRPTAHQPAMDRPYNHLMKTLSEKSQPLSKNTSLKSSPSIRTVSPVDLPKTHRTEQRMLKRSLQADFEPETKRKTDVCDLVRNAIEMFGGEFRAPRDSNRSKERDTGNQRSPSHEGSRAINSRQSPEHPKGSPTILMKLPARPPPLQLPIPSDWNPDWGTLCYENLKEIALYYQKLPIYETINKMERPFKCKVADDYNTFLRGLNKKEKERKLSMALRNYLPEWLAANQDWEVEQKANQVRLEGRYLSLRVHGVTDEEKFCINMANAVCHMLYSCFEYRHRIIQNESYSNMSRALADIFKGNVSSSSALLEKSKMVQLARGRELRNVIGEILGNLESLSRGLMGMDVITQYLCDRCHERSTTMAYRQNTVLEIRERSFYDSLNREFFTDSKPTRPCEPCYFGERHVKHTRYEPDKFHIMSVHVEDRGPNLIDDLEINSIIEMFGSLWIIRSFIERLSFNSFCAHFKIAAQWFISGNNWVEQHETSLQTFDIQAILFEKLPDPGE